MRRRAQDPTDAVGAALARRDVLGLAMLPVDSLRSAASGVGFDGGVVSHPDGRHLLVVTKEKGAVAGREG